jgi:hypothetical protein
MSVTPRRRVDIIRKRAEPAGTAEPDRRNPDRQQIERYMRTTAIIAALVLASVGASAQTETRRDWIDPPEYEQQPMAPCHKVGYSVWCDAQNGAPSILSLGGRCPPGYTTSGSYCVPRGGGFWIPMGPGDGVPR